MNPSRPATPAPSRQLALLKATERRAQGDAGRISVSSPAPEDHFSRLYPQAECLKSPEGRCYRLVTEADLNGNPTRQGYRCPVAKLGLPPTPAQLAAMTGEPSWADLAPESILYFDTETTGLSGGSGTYVFLIGLGHFSGERFILEQYFMHDLDGEAALLARVGERLGKAGAVVGYNSRSFDAPLLEVRWRMQRQTPPLPALHLDLLHYVRRVWRMRLERCSLGHVERHLLNLRRWSDVDGACVPGIYHDFTRGKNTEALVPVIDHHAQDIYSLGALTSLLASVFDNPEHTSVAHAEDQWGLSRWLRRVGKTERSLVSLERACAMAHHPDFSYALSMHLARAHQRCGNMDAALALWQMWAKQATSRRLDPIISLAKHAEHRDKDLSTAREWTLRAIALIEQIEAIETDLHAKRERIALDQRLARLDRRLARKG